MDKLFLRPRLLLHFVWHNCTPCFQELHGGVEVWLLGYALDCLDILRLVIEFLNRSVQHPLREPFEVRPESALYFILLLLRRWRRRPADILRLSASLLLCLHWSSSTSTAQPTTTDYNAEASRVTRIDFSTLVLASFRLHIVIRERVSFPILLTLMHNPSIMVRQFLPVESGRCTWMYILSKQC